MMPERFAEMRLLRIPITINPNRGKAGMSQARFVTLIYGLAINNFSSAIFNIGKSLFADL